MPKINDYLNIFKNGILSNKKLSGIAFIDTEVGLNDKKVHDFGAVKDLDTGIHTNSKKEFENYIADSEYLCGRQMIDGETEIKEIFESYSPYSYSVSPDS